MSTEQHLGFFVVSSCLCIFNLLLVRSWESFGDRDTVHTNRFFNERSCNWDLCVFIYRQGTCRAPTTHLLIGRAETELLFVSVLLHGNLKVLIEVIDLSALSLK